VTATIKGIIPVMLTPFTEANAIDYASLEKLIEWYIANGADALFAVAQSSEMQFLSLDERVALARFVAKQAAGRVPVIASGHVSETREDQVAELTSIDFSEDIVAELERKVEIRRANDGVLSNRELATL